MLNVRMPTSLKTQIAAAAAEEHTSVSDYVRRLLEWHFADLTTPHAPPPDAAVSTAIAHRVQALSDTPTVDLTDLTYTLTLGPVADMARQLQARGLTAEPEALVDDGVEWDEGSGGFTVDREPAQSAAW
jgi:hypothetical protein